jgi:uncharacterized protein
MNPSPQNAPSPNVQASPCPICRKPEVHEFRPFCSKRCEQVDLHKWFTGGYSIPTDEEMSDDHDAFRTSNRDEEP